MTEKLNTQQVFDKVATHLLRQGRKSQNVGRGQCKSFCAYRGDDGTTCAVGCLIPDDRYNPALEGLAAQRFAVLDTIRDTVDLNETTKTLLTELQDLHDNSPVETWHLGLERLANRYNLSTSALEKTPPPPQETK